jgi:hypothetical protein
MKSQTNLILSHLKKGKTITPLQSWNLFDCFRLGARIFDLRELGYNIKTTIIKSGKKHFAEYKLIRK